MRTRIRMATVMLAWVWLAAAPPSRELIVCGWDEVFILDMTKQPPQKVWSWRAADDKGVLPDGFSEKFKTTDDCKPIGGGKVLISSSSDGIALVDRRTKAVEFYASVGNAHSLSLLPGGRIAVAGSTGNRPLCNRLVIFDLKHSARPLFNTELFSGHGVVWDQRRGRLWALGGEVLRSYRLQNWETNSPSLEKVDEYPLPDAGGHDLMPIPDTPLLSVTTNRNAWIFDRDKGRFAPHPQLGGKESVKSITVHPTTRQIVWTQADKGFWWTESLRFLNPESTHIMPGERLYKARWVDAVD